MNTAGYVSAFLAYIVGGSITFALLRWLGKGAPELAFIVGALLGIQIAAVVHSRSPGAVSSFGVKLGIGAASALGTILLGMVMHALWKPFIYPEISITFGVVGAFVFPFVLFEMFWKTLARRPNA